MAQPNSVERPTCVEIATAPTVNKDVEGRLQPVIPFMGARIFKDHPPTFGIGYYLPQEGNRQLFWDTFPLPPLIRSWRAMQLLSEVKEVTVPDTLREVWQATNRNPDIWEQNIINQLVEKQGGRPFSQSRERILNSVPEEDALKDICLRVLQHNIAVDVDELRTEIKENRLPRHNLVIGMIDADDRKNRKKDDLTIPVPPEKSLAVLLEDLGIKNILSIDGDDLQSRCIVSPHGYERSLRERSLRTDIAAPFLVYREPFSSWVFDPETGQPIARLNDDNAVINPSVTLPDGIKYTFIKSRYTEGNSLVTAHISANSGEPLLNGEFNVPEFRTLFAKVLPNPARKLFRFGPLIDFEGRFPHKYSPN